MMPTGVVKQGENINLTKSCCNELNYKSNAAIEDESNSLAISAYNMAIEVFSYASTNSCYFQAENNGFILNVNANPNYGLPFGKPARLLFELIVNEIKFTKSPVLRLGKIYQNLRHISQLSKKLDTQNNSKNLYEQMLRLFASKITFSFQQEGIINKFDFWWNSLKGKKENISGSSIIVVTKELFIGLSHLKINSNKIKLNFQ